MVAPSLVKSRSFVLSFSFLSDEALASGSNLIFGRFKLFLQFTDTGSVDDGERLESFCYWSYLRIILSQTIDGILNENHAI